MSQRANDSLADEGTSLDAYLAAINARRQREGLPYLYIVKEQWGNLGEQLPAAEDWWAVYFAIRLVSATKIDRAISRKAPSEDEMLRQQFSFLSAVTSDSSAVHRAVELRYVSLPDQELPQRGKLRIGFICKVAYSDVDTTIRLANAFMEDIYAILPLTETQTYQFVPAYTAQEFMDLFDPFPVSDIGEIVKREDIVNIGGGKEVYVAYPFSSSMQPSMYHILWKLLRERGKYLLSVCVMPTSLLPWERQTLREIVDACESIHAETEIEETVTGGRVKGTTRYPARARAYAVGRVFQQYLHGLSGNAWVLKVQIASDDTINRGVLETVGTQIAGVPEYDPERGVFGVGGYVVVQPTTVEEFKIAQDNLKYLKHDHWQYSLAPDHLTRLRHLVGPEEAFRAFRLPLPQEEGIPGVELQMVKYSPLPANMPAEGIILGESLYTAMRQPAKVMIKADDRRRHVYVVGKTGVGKSTLLLEMALADIRNGSGVCVVDPHGELIEDLLLRLPPERVEDVILFDPSDEERPVGLNMLEAETEQEKHLIVNEMIGLMYKLYDPHRQGIVGPRFEHAVRNAMLTVMAQPGNTLIEVVGVLTNNQFRAEKVKDVKDPLVRSYWHDQIAHTADYHKSEVLDYIVSKFGRFVTNQLVRNIIGQSESAFDFRDVIDQRKILLVSLSKGKIGPENSIFLGSVLVPKLLIAALSRVEIPRERRHDFYLYVDEFHNFASETFAVMLSEARKYGIAITMAHQYLDQIPEAMRAAVFGNVGTIISFRVGIDDVRHLAPEFYPVFDADDLTNLPKYTACVKLLVDGLAVRPLSMRTLFDPDSGVNHEVAQKAREFSRQTYGKPREQVAKEIARRGRGWIKLEEEENGEEPGDFDSFRSL